MRREVYLDLTAAASAVGAVLHVFEQLGDGIVVSSRTDVEHERELRLQVLTDALEEPLVAVDFSVVPEDDPIRANFLRFRRNVLEGDT